MKHFKRWPDLLVLLWLQESFTWGVEASTFVCFRFTGVFFDTVDWRLNPTCGGTFLLEKWVPETSFQVQTSSSQSLAVFYIVALSDWPLSFCISPDPVSLTFWTRSDTAFLEQLKVPCFLQTLLAFHPISWESFFMTAICSFFKTVF